MPLRTYQGACHCGATRFEVEMDLDHVRACDCTICRKRGALNHRVEVHQLKLQTPLERLTLYQWHTYTAEDYFCPTCGVLPFRKPRARTQSETEQGVPRFTGWTINVRCLDGVDLDAIPVRPVHGSRLP